MGQSPVASPSTSPQTSMKNMPIYEALAQAFGPRRGTRSREDVGSANAGLVWILGQTIMRRACASAAIALAAVFSSIGAQAQSYPTRSLKIVVPATPGGAIDVIARLVGDKLTASMGQAVIIENKPGASNNLGTDFVAKSPPDGYTLVIVASSHATNKFLFKELP